MKSLFTSIIKDETGAAAVEYGLIAALISIGIIVAATSLGTELSTTFTFIKDKLAASRV